MIAGADMDLVTRVDERTRALEFAAEHGVDAQTVEEHCASAFVAELVEESVTLLVQALGSLVMTGDVRRAPEGPQRVRSDVGPDRLGVGPLEQALEPAHALFGIVGHPELLGGGGELESEGDRPAAHGPRERAADVVRLRDRHVEALATRPKLAGI